MISDKEEQSQQEAFAEMRDQINSEILFNKGYHKNFPLDGLLHEFAVIATEDGIKYCLIPGMFRMTQEHDQVRYYRTIHKWPQSVKNIAIRIMESMLKELKND